MKSSPEVSIIIRTKNEERWIGTCLDKIFSQSYKDFEVILADNCSQDKTLTKAKKYPIRHIIVCLSAHCIPVDNNWLKRLVKPLKNKKIAGVYGRQEPMPYSSDFDKRDLLLLFGQDKKIQTKDPFFHNANSSFLRETWNKNHFDEKTPNIEDRIWGSRVISKGFKIIYEPTASVFHFHGVHQNLDPDRCASVVRIMEKISKKNYLSNNSFKKNSQKKLKTIAILPIRGKPIKYLNKYLMEFTIKKILKDKLISEIYVSTDDKETAKISRSFGAKCPFIRPKNLTDKFTDIISVAKHALEKIEKKNIFPDLVYLVTDTYPLREKNLLANMLNKLKKDGLEAITASKKEKAGIWLKNINQKKLKKMVDNVTPGTLRDNDTFVVPLGLGHLTYAHKLRAGEFFNENFDLFPIENSLSTLEIREERSFKNFLDIIN